MRKNIVTISAFLAVFIFYTVFYYLGKGQVPIMDERFHYPQIVRFSQLDFSPDPALAMGPGYHFLLGLPFVLLPLNDIWLVRLVNLLFSFAALLIFYKCAVSVSRKNALLRLLMFAFFAVNGFYFILLYSDIVSLMFVLLSLFFASRKLIFMSGFFGIISLPVRQMNIFPLTAVFFMNYMEYSHGRVSLGNILDFLKRSWIFLLGFAGFFVYFLSNPMVSAGEGARQFLSPRLSFNNLYLFLFLYFFLFLPENIARVPKIFGVIRKYFHIVLPLSVLFFLVFTETARNTHPWNVTPFFLRNAVFNTLSSSVPMKILFFFPCLISVFLLIFDGYERPYFRIVNLIFAAMLLSIWLIEPRYAIPFFAFLILFRKVESTKTYFLQILLNALLTVYLTLGTINLAFFP